MCQHILKASLVLGLLSGVAVVSRAEMPQKIESTRTEAFANYKDYGPYEERMSALKDQKHWQKLGHATNIVTHQSYEVALVGNGGNFPVAM